MTVTVGSLFAGIGGFDLAFHRTGTEVTWQVEIDPECRKVLRRHFPDALLLDDVCEVGAHNLPAVDVMTFGSPCQDVSVAGQRKGLVHGERSNLFFEATRIVGELRPALVLFENVPGLFSSNGGRDFATILGAFRDLGARDICWRVIDAQHSGVPQRRRRIFLVADFGGERAAEILLEPSSSFRHPAPSREAGSSVAASLTAGSATGRGVNRPGRRREDDSNIIPVGAQSANGVGTCGADDSQAQAGHLVPIASAEDRGAAYGCNGQSHYVGNQITLSASDDNGSNHLCVTHALTAEGADASEDGTGRGTPLAVVPILEAGARQGTKDDKRDGTGIGEPGDPMFTLQSSKQHAIAFDTTQITSAGNYSHPKAGDPCHALAAGAHPPAIAFTERTRAAGRTFEASEEVAYALTNPGLGGRTHSRQIAVGYAVRRLTPRECERLQGFPDDWTRFGADESELSDSFRYRALGNAVAVPCIAFIARRVAAVFLERAVETLA